jgi:hypothetical protein
MMGSGFLVLDMRICVVQRESLRYVQLARVCENTSMIECSSWMSKIDFLVLRVSK